jgi:hypothetical protein
VTNRFMGQRAVEVTFSIFFPHLPFLIVFFSRKTKLTLAVLPAT